MTEIKNNIKTDEDSLHSITTGASKLSNRTFTISIPTKDVIKDKLAKSERAKYGVIALAFILVAVISGSIGGWLVNKNNDGGLLNNSLSNQKQIVTSDSQLITEIAKTVGQSVVSVNVSVAGSSTGSATGGFGLFGFSQPEQEQVAGTGIIISSDGLIITNRHVVPAGSTNVSVTLSNGTELKDVSIVGRTSPQDSLDIAFLKVNNADGQKLVPAAIGNSSQMQVGNSVVAIGNALGQFQNTVTSGIISGYGRSVTASDGGGGSSTGALGQLPSTGTTENLNDLFQTDAAINEGNSGGPLVNLNGQVIGINTAIAGNAQNIGFSIPIDDVKGLINQVLKTGKFTLPYLGIRYIPLTADVAKEYNLSVNNGAFVAPSSDPNSPSVITGSPAANAGLKVLDVITEVNGVQIDQGHSLTSLLDQYTPGTNVSLIVIRDGKSIQINVTLGTDPNS
jgi:S1-C subfamily serine protease